MVGGGGAGGGYLLYFSSKQNTCLYWKSMKHICVRASLRRFKSVFLSRAGNFSLAIFSMFQVPVEGLKFLNLDGGRNGPKVDANVEFKVF